MAATIAPILQIEDANPAVWAILVGVTPRRDLVEAAAARDDDHEKQNPKEALHTARIALSIAASIACGRPSTPPSAATSADSGLDAAPIVVHLSDESSIALLGVKMMDIHDPDAPDLERAMHAAYARMRADEDSGALVIVDRERMWLSSTSKTSDLGVVFLHGYGGRFALPCWQVTHALASLDATVACPSIGTDGDWWTPKGKALVTETIAALRAAGSKRVVLVGLSNGGIGVTRIAPGLGIDAAIAISGADPSAPAPGVPALVIHGKKDAMSSAASARAWATKSRATYVELDAGHFVMLRNASETEAALLAFVRSSSARR